MATNPVNVAPRLQLFADSVASVRETLQYFEWAVANLQIMSVATEANVIAESARFPVIVAVWIDDTTRQLRTRRIKGVEGAPGGKVMANAIPVADEAEALRWGAVLSAADATPPTPNRGPQLVVRDGARVESQVTTSPDS